MFYQNQKYSTNGKLKIVAPSRKNNNPNILDSFLIMAKFLFMFCLWIISSSYLDISFLSGGVYFFKRSFPTPVPSWILVLVNIKVKAFWNNNISYENINTGLIGRNWLLRFFINTKNKWTIWDTSSVTFGCYIWRRAEGWHFIYGIVIWWSVTFETVVHGGFNYKG